MNLNCHTYSSVNYLPLPSWYQCCGSASFWCGSRCGSGFDFWCGSGCRFWFLFHVHPDADPDILFDADADPTFHPDANPDPDPSFQIKAQNHWKSAKIGSCTIHFGLTSAKRIRIQLINFDADPDLHFMRIRMRIQVTRKNAQICTGYTQTFPKLANFQSI